MSLAVPMESWRAPYVERREGGLDGGYGLFATEAIDEGAILAIKGGQLVAEETIEANADVINGSHVQVAPDLFITGIDEEEVDRTLIGWNHSCDPNAFVDGQIVIRAMHPIREDEEVTIDYATAFSSDTQAFECQCGNDGHCRGYIIPSVDSSDPELRHRYSGYFADFLAFPEAYEDVDLRPINPDVAVTSWLSTKAERVEDSEIHSIGLVATEHIRAGELLAVKGGHLMTAAEVMANKDVIQGSEVQLPGDMFMAGLTDEERLAALLGFNHRCLTPNSILRRQISIFALTDIAPGKELTEEYGTAFSGPSQKFPCGCGSSHCRKQVDTSVDWKNKEVRRVFEGMFADHVQEKIDQEAA